MLKKQWPEGDSMAVNCPNCTALVDVQIAVVRGNDMLFRPADCDACGAEFDLMADGTTDLTFAPPKTTTAKGLELIKTTFVFDPDPPESEAPMSNVITQRLDDDALEQLLIQAWHLGFNTSTERCNGEFPNGLEDDGKADVQELIETYQSTLICTLQGKLGELSSDAAMPIYLVMATSNASKPPIPLRAFEDGAQAAKWQDEVISYHINPPDMPYGDDADSWRVYRAQMAAWGSAHPAGIAASSYHRFGVYHVPIEL